MIPGPRGGRVATVVAMAGVLAACQADRPLVTAPTLQLRAGVVSADATHDEPDPEVAPTCNGFTATIWYNMPVDRIPAGAVVRPAVRDDANDHAIAGTTHEDGDEASGYVIIGTSGADVIVGSPQRDSLLAENGNDVVCGDPSHSEDGHDAVVVDQEDGHDEGGSPGQGGGGPDHIWGGNGQDTIYGGGGPDSIYAGNGDDSVYGGGGPDAIWGDNGNDVLYGGPGPDLLHGGHGDDSLYGDAAADTLIGDAGNDHLFGGGGLDVLDGGSGDNVLDPGE